ncbi:MAG: GNAT family N-acetyltransferase [Flavisolibacter sp.]
MRQFNFHPLPILTTERLILRPLENSDREEIYFLRSDEQANEFIDRPRATSMDDAENFIKYIQTAVQGNESLYWSITLKNSNKLIGTICYWNIQPQLSKAEIGYQLHTSYHRKGIMHETFSIVIPFGLNTIGFEIIEAYTHKDNLGSIRLLEKNNFKRDLLEEKKHSDLFNIVIYTLNSPG